MLAMALGAPGIFLVAFLDSSILSLPEVADLLVIWMVTNNKSRIVIYVVSATLGSLLGCLLLYGIGKKGGAGFVHRRFGSTNVERALEAFRRHGIMAVLIPVDPAAAGALQDLRAPGRSGGHQRRAVQHGNPDRARRALHVEGLLALWYGERAIAFIQQNGTTIALAAVIIIAVGFLVYLRVSRSRPPAVDKLQ